MAQVPQTTEELVISRAELIYVLNTLHVTRIVGMELKEFALPKLQLDAMLRDGEHSLIARSQLTVNQQTRSFVLSPTAIGLVRALAFRDLAFILIRGVRGKGQQLFVFNRYQNMLVEHTLPRASQHRLATVGTLDDLFARLESLVPLQPVLREDRPEFTITPVRFEQARQQIQTGQVSEAISTLVAAGLDENLAPLLVQSLQKPLFTLSLACVKCERDMAVAVSSVAVFADEKSSWGIWPDMAEENNHDLLVFPTGINDIKSAFIDWLGLRDEHAPSESAQSMNKDAGSKSMASEQ